MEAAGAAGTGAGYELTCELPFRARREGAGLLVAHMDPLDLALMDGVGDAVERVADDSVASLYAGCLQCFDYYVGHPLTHVRISRVVASSPWTDDLVVMPSGRQILAFFGSPHHRPQNHGSRPYHAEFSHSQGQTPPSHSAMVQLNVCCFPLAMSASPPTPDVSLQSTNRRFGPN